MSATLDLLLLATNWAHVLLAPYTKVEESFNLHATHDVLMYGVGADALHKYDHFVFPGAVPRTFIGSILLAWISTPVLRVCRELGVLTDKADMQVVVRLVLATCNALGLSLLRRGVSRRYGGLTGVLFVLLTCTQFHLPFWMGRTLPNMFALLPVNVALYKLWDRAPNATRPTPRNIDIAISLLVFAAIVFRGELALLLGPIVLQALWSGYTSIARVLRVGLVSSLVSIALTVLVDSYFWQQWPLWPELYGVYFNVVQGKSADWGVSPFYTYFWSLLPRLLMAHVFLLPVGFISDSRIRSLILPQLVFVGLLSFLGHKEWRFVVYVVPTFNIVAARGGHWLFTRPKSSWFGRIAFVAAAGCLVVNILGTYTGIMSSANNYPGGEALRRFNEMYAADKNVHVHISNLAAQTGASLFLQTHAPPYPEGLNLEPPQGTTSWIYNKTESVTPAQLTVNRKITHAIAEIDSSKVATAFDGTGFPGRYWKLTGVVTGFDKIQLDLPALKTDFTRPWEVLKFVRSEKLAILEKK